MKGEIGLKFDSKRAEFNQKWRDPGSILSVVAFNVWVY
jgi:hypothetical protein